MIGERGDADAGAHVDPVILEIHRHFERDQDRARDVAGRAGVAAGQKHREFVAAKARYDRTFGGDHGAEP